MPRQSYSAAASRVNKPTPMSVQAHPAEVRNPAGGYVFNMTEENAFRQFLVLGTRNGSFYVNENVLTAQATQRALLYIKSDPFRAIQIVEECIPVAVNRDTLILALSMVLALDSLPPVTKSRARAVMQKVFNTPYDMYTFLNFHKSGDMGWGRAKTRTVAEYFERQVDSYLVLMGLKYRQREGFTLLDAARLGHPKMGRATSKRNIIFRWACGMPWTDSQSAIAEELFIHEDFDLQQIFVWIEINQPENSERRVANLIRDFRLPRECVPTHFLNSAEVWEALLVNMPVQAVLRNMGKMSSIHVDFLPRLEVALARDTRLHPLDILKAFAVYKQGHGDRGKLSWMPRMDVIKCLLNEYNRRLNTMPPRQERLLIAVDVSGSMEFNRPFGDLHTSHWAYMLAVSLQRQYPNSKIVGYSEKMIEPNESYMKGEIDVEGFTSLTWRDMWYGENGGGTNESAVLPTISQQPHEPFDAVVFISDGDTWMGDGHPFQTVADYRAAFNPNLVSVCFTITAQGQTRNEPDDALSFDLISAGDGTTASQLAAILDFVASVRG